MWLIESSNQVHSPATGDARTCGSGADCVQDTLLSRWATIFSMTALSSIAAITLAVPPQTRHLYTSMLNTRLSLWAGKAQNKKMTAGCAPSATEVGALSIALVASSRPEYGRNSLRGFCVDQ
jgi:hypothetical protein